MTTTESEKSFITFKLSTAEKAELEALALSRERTLSAELRLAVKAYLLNARSTTT